MWNLLCVDVDMVLPAALTTGYLVSLSVGCERCGFAGDLERAGVHHGADRAAGGGDPHLEEHAADRHDRHRGAGSERAVLVGEADRLELGGSRHGASPLSRFTGKFAIHASISLSSHAILPPTSRERGNLPCCIHFQSVT